MTVIPFPACRFTPADLVAFYRIALPKCSRGAWAAVARQTGRHHDRLLISLPGIEDPVFIFERDAGGRYRLWFREGGTRCIGSAATAEECLGVWHAAPVRRRSGAVPGR
ncbi:hypothetical protein IGS68_23315 [Skermanella sp. TT6]|uniref:Uncharacterized protein n=1 Tax=Skermanella cutis TaxID=2775420 RepID=A0ABX7B6A3_9PROT|nr:hypothetical protein [Skermanella sp. TT6]QQP88908.1 hypothetical protein IGS68_23315 [Skermanella sp. TT6]